MSLSLSPSLSRRRAVLPVAAALCAVALTSGPALASGGGTGGGGTGGAGTGGGGTATGGTATGGTATGGTAPTDPTVSGGSPCVKIDALSPAVDQSVVTDGAWLEGNYTVSRCGGNNTSFLVRLTADDAAGNRVLSTTDTWYPTKNLPFSGGHDSDSALFGTAYRVSATVLVPETGAVVTTSTRTVSTPAARVPTCVSATNLGGTAGYYPGRTTDGALWLNWTVKNCGGRDAVDTEFSVRNSDTGEVVRTYPGSAVLAPGGTTGVGLIDVEPVPTGAPYEVRIEAREHRDGQLLDSRSIFLRTPDAK